MEFEISAHLMSVNASAADWNAFTGMFTHDLYAHYALIPLEREREKKQQEKKI